jgi:hypothetical protein
MPLLVIKIVLSAALVAAATIVQRRYGHRASGFLVGLPITTAPYLMLVSIEHGAQFTTHSAQGVLQGQIALVLFIAALVADSRFGNRPLLARDNPCVVTSFSAASDFFHVDCDLVTHT